MSGDSNGAWGLLAEADSEYAAAWDGYDRLPEPGDNVAFDEFLERKHITAGALVRLGARLADDTTLAFAYRGGLKFRDIITGRRWTYLGSTFDEMRVVQKHAEPSRQVIIAEGETDGARLTDAYDCDVAIMPAGARYFTERYASQVAGYDIVLAGLDNDEAGEAGSAKVLELLPQAMRFEPPHGSDWCEAESFPPLPTEPSRRLEEQLAVKLGDLLQMEVPDVASWYEHALLPIGGQAMLHGWAKNFKSFIAFDWMAALAQGQDWSTFEPTEEPCKVLIIQFEITFPYYRQRMDLLLDHAREPTLLKENLHTWTPMTRPQLIAGNTKQEDIILRTLSTLGIQVVLLDPVRRATGAIDMNAEGEVRKMLHFFERMQSEGVTVIATHHDNKTGGRAGGGDPLNMTGSGAWSGDADSIVSISVPKGEDWRTSPKRNIDFTLRNAPSPGARGFAIQEDGRILYSPEPYGTWNQEEDDAESNTPSI